MRAALLDLRAAGQQLEAAQANVTLAGQELEQARDRFAAGVAGNIEVSQAQQSVAIASESYIEALYAHNLAKASLARAVGTAEQSVMAFLGGIEVDGPEGENAADDQATAAAKPRALRGTRPLARHRRRDHRCRSRGVHLAHRGPRVDRRCAD